MRKPRLLYILPEYDANAPTHHVHIFELLEKLGERLEIFLLVEKSVGQPEIKNLKEIYVPKNFLDRFLTIIRVRSRGYKKAYVHYSYWGGILASLVMRLTGGRVYYWHCEVYDKFFSGFTFSLEGIKKKLLDEYLMVLTLNLVNYLVTGTKTVGEFYRRQFNLPRSKIKIVPNWVNLERFGIKATKLTLRRKLKLPLAKKIVIFAHRLAPRKGADRLPQIVTEIVKAVPDAYFFIAGGGGGELKDWLVKEFSRQKLQKYTRLSPGIPNLELPRYLGAGDLFIMPSRQEGFPRILIECMAASLPFVATDVGGTKDILNPNQKNYLIPANNFDSFIKKTIFLLQTPRKLKELSVSGKNQVRQYDIDVVAQKFIKLLSS